MPKEVVHLGNPGDPGFREGLDALFDQISDAPVSAADYVDYAIDFVQGRMDHWKAGDEHQARTRACVVANLDTALHHLDELRRRMIREGLHAPLSD